MRWRRPTAIGLVLSAAVLAGCTQEARPAQERVQAGGGSESWRPPEGAPPFCAALAGSDHLDRIPEAVGRLVADPADTRQAWRLTQGVGDLREVRDAVRDDGGPEGLEAALGELIDDLTVAASGPLEEADAERIAAGLQAVGGSVQPVCEFPA